MDKNEVSTEDNLEIVEINNYNEDQDKNIEILEIVVDKLTLIDKKTYDKKKFDNKKSEKKVTDTKVLNFHKLNNCNSSITCHGRPKKGILKDYLENLKINCILTLQNSDEKADEIKKEAEIVGINWINIPLKGANLDYLSKEDTLKVIVEGLLKVYDLLVNTEINLYIHCSAGIHRTGLIVYCLLRMNGEDNENAMTILKKIRKETGEKVGEERIKIAEKLLIQSLIKK